MITDALWIGAGKDMGEICPSFKREFKTKKAVRRAVLAVTVIGVYEAEINGRRVGSFILAPGLTSYGTRLQYQTYDITDMLGTNNEINITVGKGWHRGRISMSSPDIHNTPCAVIAEIAIEYTSGETETLRTDDSWSVSGSRILFSDIYDGEIYDASANIGDSGPAVLIDLPKNILIPQEGTIVCEHERIKPVRRFTAPNGDQIIDFGQNLAGYVEFTVEAKSGDRIKISHAEVLDADGNFYTENYRSAKSEISYICRGGLQTYKPHFTFMGFRYIRLDAFPRGADLDSFTAIAIYSDMRRTGFIKTGSKKINRLFENTLWSQRANFIDIPSDCPQRDERMGWTGDAQVFAKTAGYNYDVLKFFKKWLSDVRAEQRSDGSIPDTVPNFWGLKSASASWGDVICIVPWQMYLLYGDRQILSDSFESMKRWVDYITNDTLDKYLWTSGGETKKLRNKHYGDWLALDAPAGSYKGSTSEDLIASAFYAYSAMLTVKTGRVLGEDVSEYEELYGNIVTTFKKRFTGLKTQTEHVLALYFDLTDDKRGTADRLAQMIADNGNKLQTGFVGTPYLLYALSGNGHADTAYKLLLQEDYPSWLYEVNHGATTVWEHWDGINDEGRMWSSDMNSYNHYAYGSVMDWIYTVAAGIRADENYPGFERAIIAPAADKRLGWLDASYDTPRGKITSKWTYMSGGVRYEITTPVRSVAVIDGNEYHIGKGSYIFYGEG